MRWQGQTTLEIYEPFGTGNKLRSTWLMVGSVVRRNRSQLRSSFVRKQLMNYSHWFIRILWNIHLFTLAAYLDIYIYIYIFTMTIWHMTRNIITTSKYLFNWSFAFSQGKLFGWLYVIVGRHYFGHKLCQALLAQ